MFARLLAFVCLLSSGTVIGRAEPSSVRGAIVGVFLQKDASASNLTLDAMRMELRDLMAPTGVSLVWTEATGATPSDKLIVVELRGSCQVSGSPARVKNSLNDHPSLASTAVEDGKVLPFSWVDCTVLNQLLQPAMERRSDVEREEIYGRAMGRLLAHELYHFLAQTESHTSSGISKPSFSIADLLASHLAFERDALALLRAEETITVAAGGEPDTTPLELPVTIHPDTVTAFAGR